MALPVHLWIVHPDVSHNNFALTLVNMQMMGFVMMVAVALLIQHVNMEPIVLIADQDKS